MEKREIITIATLFVVSFLIVASGIYVGQFKFAYKEISTSYLDHITDNVYISGIINLTYQDVFSVFSNVTPYLIPNGSIKNISANISQIEEYSINATNHYDDLYIYPSLQGAFIVILISSFIPSFNYTITFPTDFYYLSVILIILGISFLIASAVLVFLIILKRYE